jgi:hypothetical protein
MRIFYPNAQYSLELSVPRLPQPGDEIIITRDNLVRRGGGVDDGIFGNFKLIVDTRIEDQGWANSDENLPTYTGHVTFVNQ